MKGTDYDASESGCLRFVVSTLPLTVAPSAIVIVGAVMLPSTVAVSRTSIFVEAAVHP